MADRNRDLVPGSWNLVRERALTSRLSVLKDGILNAQMSAVAFLLNTTWKKKNLTSDLTPV